MLISCRCYSIKPRITEILPLDHIQPVMGFLSHSIGSLSALQSALEQARQNKVRTDKQKRKNPTPSRKTLASLSTNTDKSAAGESAGDNTTASEEMDQDSTDSAT